MEQLGWKEWTAIVGAVTGPINLALQLFSKRPRLAWGPSTGGADDRLTLVIDNPSTSQLMISRIKAFPTSYGFFPERQESTTDNTMRDVLDRMKKGRVPVLLKPGKTRTVNINTIKEGSWAIVIVVWHRFWLLPIRIPYVMWLSRKVANDVNKGAR